MTVAFHISGPGSWSDRSVWEGPHAALSSPAAQKVRSDVGESLITKPFA